MLSFAPLLVLLPLALSTVASSIEVRDSLVTLPIARRLNLNGGAVNLLQHDQARATALKGRKSNLGHRTDSNPIINSAFSYVAQVGIGSPATTYDLVVDTGSSNTWVGARTAYVKTNTSHNTGEDVSVSYGSGFFAGTEYTDTVSLGSGLLVTGQSIGVALSSDTVGFTNVDGIIGLGPLNLTEGSLTNEPTTTIPTVTMNLYSQGTISEMVIGVSFEPTTSQKVTNGELTFGGTDSAKYTGTIAYVPLTTTFPAANYWGIDESITYGTQTILSKTSGIVDTGTTLILLASDAYSAYQSAVGATPDNTTKLLRITLTQYNALENLNFNIGSDTYTLTPNGQIWPRSLNTYISGTSSYIYLIVNSLDTPSGGGLDFINGQAFLERFYSVFDTTNSRVGFATTPYTDGTTN